MHTKPNGQTFFEDPNKLYVFRNYTASEAQLGISDYSPTGTPASDTVEQRNTPIQQWNLLASTQTTQTIPGYNKLVLTNSLTELPVSGQPTPYPIVLTKKLNGQCIGYIPESTEVIKKTTQYGKDLIKLTSLPTGVVCE